MTLMLLILLSSGLLFTTAAAEFDGDNTAAARATTASSHIDSLKLGIGNDGKWSDARTTAIAVIALTNSGILPSDIWQNGNGASVSLANTSYNNALKWLKEYLRSASASGIGNSQDVELVALLAIDLQLLDSIKDAVIAVDLLKDDFDTETGSWDNNVYITALAGYAITVTNGRNDTVALTAAEYLHAQEQYDQWFNARDSAVATLALHVAGYDVSGEQEAITTYQSGSGGFGSIESTAWSIIALASADDSNYHESITDAQNYLAVQNVSVESDLAMAALGESVILDYSPAADYGGTAEGQVIFPITNPPQHPPENYSKPDKGTGGSGEGNNPAPPGDPDGNGKIVDLNPENEDKNGEKSGLFNVNDPFWLAVAIIVIVIIVSLASWGLIARIEEGRALEGVRRDIVEYIKHNPGEHFAGIMHEFDMSPSSTSYHLKVLEDTEQVVAHKDTKYKRYFIAGNTLSRDLQSSNYKELMGILKNATARKIVWYVLQNQGTSQKEVSGALSLHPSTVNWHAHRLQENGILEKIKSGKEVSYTIKNEDTIRTVLAILEEHT